MMKTVTRLAALITFLVISAAWAHHRLNQKIRVDYYYIPYCISCSRVLSGLQTFQDEFGARVEVRTVDCFSDEGKAAAQKYGFVTHGIVVSDDAHGLFFEQKDHGVSAEDVRVMVRKELALLSL